jgi:hypothetical protein
VTVDIDFCFQREVPAGGHRIVCGIDGIGRVPKRTLLRPIQRPDQGDGPPSFQQLSGPCEAVLRGNPVKRLCREQQVEATGRVLPGFKGAWHHADLRIGLAMLCGKRGQPLALIQGDHRIPPLGERERHPPRATPDL